MTVDLPDRSPPAVLATCYRHRMLLTRQIRALHFPAHTLRQAQSVLAGLAEEGKLASYQSDRTKEAVWYVTEEGAAWVEVHGRVKARRHRVTKESVRGPLREHTLAVNAVGVAFVAAARLRGDGCSPADWSHEHLYQISDRRGDDSVLTADAILRYTLCSEKEEWPLVRFVELDRNTETPDQLAEKVRSYARFHDYRPKPRRIPGTQGSLPAGKGWQDRFTTFPKLLVVLTGGTMAKLHRRRDTLLHLCSLDRVIAASKIVVTVTTLEELVDLGPFAPIVWTPRLDGPSDILVEGVLPQESQPSLELDLHHPAAVEGNGGVAPAGRVRTSTERQRRSGTPQLELLA